MASYLIYKDLLLFNKMVNDHANFPICYLISIEYVGRVGLHSLEIPIFRYAKMKKKKCDESYLNRMWRTIAKLYRETNLSVFIKYPMYPHAL